MKGSKVYEKKKYKKKKRYSNHDNDVDAKPFLVLVQGRCGHG